MHIKYHGLMKELGVVDAYLASEKGNGLGHLTPEKKWEKERKKERLWQGWRR